MLPRILVIAGSDSGGGAGIQADIKTAMALGAYASTALTALTAQDTLGVHAIHAVPPAFIRQQIAVALNDPGADAIKTGMLGDAAAIEAIADALAGTRLPLVVDPVMVAKGGAILLEHDALSALKRALLPLATLLTPNLPEAELLTGLQIATVGEMRHAAEILLTLGVPRRAAEGRPCRGRHGNRSARHRSGHGRVHASPPGDAPHPTAPAAPWPRPSHAGWQPACRWRQRWSGRATTCRRPSRPPPALAPVTGRSGMPRLPRDNSTCQSPLPLLGESWVREL